MIITGIINVSCLQLEIVMEQFMNSASSIWSFYIPFRVTLRAFDLFKIGSFKFPAPQGPKLRLNSPLKCRIFWSVTPLPKEKMFKWREKGMVYGHLVVSIILTCSTMWNFIILLCLATECNTFEWIVFVLHLPHYSIAVHAYSVDNNYLVKIAISALRLTELTI